MAQQPVSLHAPVGDGDGAAAADGDVAQGGGQVCLPDADGAQDQGAVGASRNRRETSSFHSCWS